MKNYPEKVKACWWGKVIAGGIGAPYEGVPYSLNLTEKDIIIDSGPNDDVELQLVWLLQAEKYGLDLDAERMSKAWLESLVTCGADEYGTALWNLHRGITPPLSGMVNNYFVNGMGAAIRSEIWACLFPGRPEIATYFAIQDASVDHWGEGVWAEIFLAALESNAFVSDDLETVIVKALEFLPEESRISQVVNHVKKCHESGVEEADIRQKIMDKFGSHNFTDCVMNLGFIIAALLYGHKDFIKTALLATNFGKDTDCTAATSGAVFGLLYGLEAFPEEMRKKVSGEIAVSEFLAPLNLPKDVETLTKRCVDLAGKLQQQLAESPRDFPAYQPCSRPEHIQQLPLYQWQIFPDGEDGNTELLETTEIHLDLAQFSGTGNHILLSTQLSVPEDLDGQLMICSNTGVTAWLDDDKILNHHSRQKMLPSFHRVEGGASIPVKLIAGKKYRLKIKLYFCISELYLTVAVADFNNQYVNMTMTV